MKEKEFNLSEYLIDIGEIDWDTKVVPEKQIKEFIKRVKEKLCLGCQGKGCSNCREIDILAGNALIDDKEIN